MLDLERSLAACEELNRLIEANDASLDDELLAAQEDFEHEAAMHFEELLRRWKRVREPGKRF